jgi:hypothetical protein
VLGVELEEPQEWWEQQPQLKQEKREKKQQNMGISSK